MIHAMQKTTACIGSEFSGSELSIQSRLMLRHPSFYFGLYLHGGPLFLTRLVFFPNLDIAAVCLLVLRVSFRLVFAGPGWPPVCSS